MLTDWAEDVMAKKKKATVKVRGISEPKKNATGGLTSKMLKDKW